MLKKIEQYIASRYLRFDEQGQIWFGNDPVGLYFMPQLATEFLTNRKVFGLRYCATTFIAGKETGCSFVEKHAIPLKKIITPVVQLSCEILGNFGFGTFRTIKVDEKEGFMVVVGTSTLGTVIKKRMKPIEEPVDAALTGIFAGAIQFFTKEPIYGVETRCVAQKDILECVWVIGREENIRYYLEQISPESINWMEKWIDEIKKVEKEVKTTNEPYKTV